MSETRFTPGPWDIEEHPDEFLIGPADECVASVERRASPSATADARLIAAAPDLFAALTSTLASHEMECGSSPDCDIYRLATAALSKARGESPDRGNRARGK